MDPIATVILERLEEPLRSKWLDFLIDNEQIQFRPLATGGFEADIRLVREHATPKQSGSTANVSSTATKKDEHAVRIAAALKSIADKERRSEPLPPYAKLCALLAATGEGDKPSAVTGNRTKDVKGHSTNSSSLTKALGAVVEESGGKGGVSSGFHENPRKRSVQWVTSRIDEMFLAKEVSLREDRGMELSYSNIFPVFVFEHFTKTFGLKSLVDQTCWDFLYSVHAHRKNNAQIDTFAQFLDEQFDGDDLVFYFHARDVMAKYKLGGLETPFGRKSEVLNFASLAHSKAESLRKSFISKAKMRLTEFPADCYMVLGIAVENYHEAKNLSLFGMEEAADDKADGEEEEYVAVQQQQRRLSRTSTTPPRSAVEASSSDAQPRHYVEEDDGRSLNAIVGMQERIRQQLEGLLRSSPSTKHRSGSTPPKKPLSPFSPSSSPSRDRATPLLRPSVAVAGTSPPSSVALPAAAAAERRRSPLRRGKTLPAIRTSRSPESSSVSSASPRSHQSVTSPSHHQLTTSLLYPPPPPHSQQSSPMNRRVLSPAQRQQQSTTRLRSSFLFEVTDLGEEKSSSPNENNNTPKLISSSNAFGSHPASSFHHPSPPPPPPASQPITLDAGNDDVSSSSAKDTGLTCASKPSPLKGFDPVVALQRALAKQGAALLDKWIVASFPSLPSSQRFGIRRQAADSLSKLTSKIGDQILRRAEHTHNEEQCGGSEGDDRDCAVVRWQVTYAEVASLQEKEEEEKQKRMVNELAREVVSSPQVQKEMNVLAESMLSDKTQGQ